MQSAATRAKEQWDLYMAPETVFRIGLGVPKTKPDPAQLIPDTVQDVAGAYKYTTEDGKRSFIYMRMRKEWKETTKPGAGEEGPDLDRSRQWPKFSLKFPDVDTDDLREDAIQFRDGSTRYTCRKTGKHYRYSFMFSEWENSE